MRCKCKKETQKTKKVSKVFKNKSINFLYNDSIEPFTEHYIFVAINGSYNEPI